MHLILVMCLFHLACALPGPGQVSHYTDSNSISSTSQNLYQRPSYSADLEINDEENPNISKHIYYHTAPDDQEEETRTILTSKPQKNYRVVFIKAPIYKPAKISLVNPNKSEEKTIIYVLSKKTDPTDLQIATPAPNAEPSKPEVYFIKYKTQEEARNVQQQIQAHYDALGGETKHNDEEIAPLQSVVGIYNNNNSSVSPKPGGTSSSSFSSNLLRNNEYIPPLALNANKLSGQPSYLPPEKF